MVLFRGELPRFHAGAVLQAPQKALRVDRRWRVAQRQACCYATSVRRGAASFICAAAARSSPPKGIVATSVCSLMVRSLFDTGMRVYPSRARPKPAAVGYGIEAGFYRGVTREAGRYRRGNPPVALLPVNICCSQRCRPRPPAPLGKPLCSAPRSAAEVGIAGVPAREGERRIQECMV